MTRIIGFALIVAGISLLLCVVLSLWNLSLKSREKFLHENA